MRSPASNALSQAGLTSTFSATSSTLSPASTRCVRTYSLVEAGPSGSRRPCTAATTPSVSDADDGQDAGIKSPVETLDRNLWSQYSRTCVRAIQVISWSSHQMKVQFSYLPETSRNPATAPPRRGLLVLWAPISTVRTRTAGPNGQAGNPVRTPRRGRDRRECRALAADLPVDPSSGELVDQRLEATPFGSSGAPRSCIPPSAVTITTGGEMPGACVMFSEGSSAPTTQHHH